MKSHTSSSSRRCPFALPLLALCLFASSALALVMRDNGPEPVIVQIKDSLRLSADLDSSLEALATLQADAGVNVEKWWAGGKLLELVSFPQGFTEKQALEVLKALQDSAAVEKVVAVSAFNLEFKPGDFAREYASNQSIPEAARRGLDAEEWLRAARPTCSPTQEVATAPHVPNQIIVRWKSEYVWNASQTGFRRSITDFHTSAGTHLLQEMTPTTTDLIQVIELDDPQTSLAEKLKKYADSPWVDYAQPNYIYSYFTVTPNDPYYNNPGQSYLQRIQAPAAWSFTTGDHQWVVAVADGGANVTHPDFAPSPGHPGNLSDGWRNYYPGQPMNDVRDDDFGVWHGSHVASIIGAIGNNGRYMTGVAWDVRLLILKTPPDSAHGFQAIDYAWSNDGHEPAIAINISWGLGPRPCLDTALTDAVKRAQAHNMVVVVAAGNGDDSFHIGYNLEDSDKLFTPGSVPTDNVITVGATRIRPDQPAQTDSKPTFSNYGKYRVELGAPGGEDGEEDGVTFGILGLTQNLTKDPGSPDPCGDSFPPCNKLSGTSFSAPQVVGALVLVKDQYPWEDYAGLRDRVLMSTEDIPALAGLFRTGGRLNVRTALEPRTLIKNLSTRARVEGGDKVMIAGFVIGGSSNAMPLTVGIRGLGPSLAAAGVTGPLLGDPVIELHGPAGFVTISNDNWQDDEHWQDTVAYGLQPSDPSEAAMVRSLPPGAYTAIVRSHGSSNDYGVGLVELYALATTPAGNDEQSRFKNISTRCLVGTGDNVAIAGTILQNAGGSSIQTPTPVGVPKRRVLSFGRGPSLQRFGLTGLLPNPYLEFHQVIDDEDTIIAYNDQWKEIDGPSTGLEDKLVEARFMPEPNVEQYLNESALWPTLQPDSYTAILRDAGGASGIGLIEFYEN